MRLPEDETYLALASEPGRLQLSGIASLTRIGDCLAPSTIAAAVYAGHRAARELGEPATIDIPFKREMVALG
jgi:dimethylamine/trimethylamine dehydrogenase